MGHQANDPKFHLQLVTMHQVQAMIAEVPEEGASTATPPAPLVEQCNVFRAPSLMSSGSEGYRSAESTGLGFKAK